MSFWRQGRLLAKTVNTRLPNVYKAYSANLGTNGSTFTLVARLTTASGKRFSSEGTVSESADEKSSDIEASSSSSDEGSSSSDEGSSSSDEDVAVDEQRTSILEASLRFVPELGWGAAALAEGAREVGFPGSEGDLLPRGAGELVDHFDTGCNKKLVEFMKQQEEVNGGMMMRFSVEHRLRMLIPYVDKWPRALALKALPTNVPTALENMALLVDDMWYYGGGDRSTDFNWYTKRALLAAVYTSTELYMVQDNSVDFEETWAFLDNRMKETQTFGHNFKQFQGVLWGGVKMLTARIAMARNTAGMKDRGC